MFDFGITEALPTYSRVGDLLNKAIVTRWVQAGWVVTFKQLPEHPEALDVYFPTLEPVVLTSQRRVDQ